MNYKYKDCEGVEQSLDRYHMHELLDRLHIMQNMWEDFIQNHPACDVLFMEGRAQEIQNLMGEMYQEIGRIEWEEFKDE